MRSPYFRTLLPIFILMVFVSEQSGVDVSTDVQTTGDSEVYVETNVDTAGSESTVYKRLEVDVNGEKQVVESYEEGETSLEVTSESNGVADVEEGDSPDLTSENGVEIEESDLTEPAVEFNYVSFGDYLMSLVRNFFSGLFS